MSIHKIRSALVETFSGGIGLSGVYENTNGYTPQADTPWFEFFMIPNRPVVVTIGDEGLNEHTGIVQVNLNYPIHEGSGNMLQKVDEVSALFKAGSRHVFEGQTVSISSCGLDGSSQIVNGFFQSILTIQYKAQTPR